MTRLVPPYPRPLPDWPRWLRPALLPWKMARALRCSLAQLVERSYVMKMGETGLPRRRLLIANEPALIERILVSDLARFPKAQVAADMFGTLVGDGLIVSNGETWARQRRIMDPVFEQTRNRLVFDLMAEAIGAMTARLASRIEAGEREVMIDEEMTHVTADVIYRTIFGDALPDADARAAFGAFQAFQEAAFRHGMVRMAGLPQRLAGTGFETARAQAAIIRALLDPRVETRTRALREEGATPGDDILDALILARDPVDGSRFDLRELQEQTAMLFLGGHETSASTLAWNFYLLARAPAVQDRVRAEIDAVLGGRAPAYADVKRLRYTRAVFFETMRLYPPIPFLPRDTACPMRLRDKDVPAGTTVTVSPWLMHRHRRHWRDPDAFDPDRFLTDTERQTIRDCFIPFSKGPRVCIGASFAQQEAILALHAVVARWRLETVPGFEVRPAGRLTVRSLNGIRLRLVPR